MGRGGVKPGTLCKEQGCSNPRHVLPNGASVTRCTSHYRVYTSAKNKRHWLARKNNTVKGKGRPAGPTVIIDERERIVRQIVGNDVIREIPLPDRGLHEQTLAILKYRGWKIKFERGAA